MAGFLLECMAGFIGIRTYRALSPHEQTRIITRMVLGFARYNAKRRGEPLPIPYTYEPKLAPGGGLRSYEGTLRPMTNEEILAIVPHWFD
ncbi:MAG TPA: hypothetical protein VGF39_10505 [Stellaceae bacterium]